MPYITSKGKDGKFCNYKKGEDGKPSGKALGCFDSLSKAGSQLRAIYANEGKSLVMIDEFKTELIWHDADKDKVIAQFGAEKSITLWDLEDKVRIAIREKMMAVTGAKDEYDMPYYGCEIFLDFVIVKAPKGLYQIAYSVAPDTYAITLGEPKKVKIEYVPDDAPEQDMADMEDHAYMAMMEKSADLTVIKALGDNRVGSYAVLWGDEAKKDLTGEFFDQKTEELTTIFEAVGKLPYLYHHGLDETLKTSVIGIVDTLLMDSIGLWYEAQLKLAGEYEEAVKKLFAEKKLKTSTQTFPVARRVSKNGHIDRWPIVEITATPTPAEYRMQPVETLKGAFTEIGYDNIASVFKAKLGIDGDGSIHGAEKARMLTTLEMYMIELLDF